MMLTIRVLSLVLTATIFAPTLGAADLLYEDTPQFSTAFQAGNYSTLSIPAYNLQLSKPEGWEATGVQQKENILYLNFKQKSGATLQIIAMDIGYFPPESFADVKSESDSFLRDSYPDRQVTLKYLREAAISGLSGFVREVETKAGSPAFREIMWDGSRNGFNYILRYRFAPDSSDAAQAWQNITNAIKFGDAKAVSPRFEKGKPADTQSKAYGYRVKAAGTFFTVLPTNAQAYGKPEHAFTHSQRTAIAYFPVIIRNTRLEPKDILRGMFTGLDVSKDMTLGKISSETVNNMTVVKAEGTGTGKQRDYLYEMRLFAKAPVYVVELIAERTFDGGKRRAPQRLTFSFDGRSGEVRDSDFSEDQKRRHFHFLMKIGMQLKNESKAAQAKDFFEEAITYHIDDAAAVNHLCTIYDKMKNYSAGYALTEQHKALVEKNPNLLSFKAFFAYKLERFAEAAQLYESSFEQGYWAADEFEFMLKALASTKQNDKADALADKYLAQQKNEDLMRHVVRYLREEKRFKKAEEVLQAAEKKFGLTEKIGYDYGKVYFDQGKFREGIELCDRMEKAGFSDPVIQLNRGMFLYASKDFLKARDAFRQYQKLGGQEETAANYLKTIEDILEKTPAVYNSADFAYKLRIAGTGFRAWENFATELPNAEFGLLYDDFGGMAIFSVKTDKLSPQQISSADFLRIINADHAKVMGKPLRQAVKNGVTTEDYEYTMSVENRPYFYQVRFFKRKHAQHAAFLWFAKSAGEDQERRKLLAIAENFEFDEAANIAAASARTHKIQGYFAAQIGEMQFKAGEVNKAITNLTYAHEIDGGNAKALTLLMQSLARTEDYARIHALTVSAEKKFPKDQGLISWKAFSLYKLNRLNESAAMYAALFAGGYWNDHDFRDYVDVLARLGKEDELLKQLESNYKLHPSPEMGLTYANYLRKYRRYEKAEGVYRTLVAENPRNLDAQIEMGWLYVYMGVHTKALDICNELIRNKMQTVPVEYLKGVALYKLSRYREAKPSFEFAVRANPKDADARDYLNYINSILGQGQNSDIQTAVKPVEIPGGYESAAGTDKEDAASLIHRAIKAVYFKKNEPERTTYYYNFSILKDAGIAAHSKYTFTFDPLRERIFVNKLEVRDSQNNFKAKGKPEEYYVVDEVDDSNITTGKKELQIVVPGLSAGSRVELLVSRESLQSVTHLPFISYYMASSIKTLLSQYYVCGDLTDLAAYQVNVAAPQNEKNCKVWSKKNPVIMARESLRAPSKSFAPIVYSGSAQGNWRDLNRDYFAKIRDRLVPDEAVQKLSAQIVGEAKTRDEKLRRLTAYVQNSIKYQAIEFGTRGVIPNFPAKTLSDKFGDCKDQSVLLHALLKAQGIDSVLALIHTHTPFVDKIPSLDQFNHMIVYLPEKTSGTFFDPTQKNFGIAPLPPVYLHGQTAMLVREAGPKFEEIAVPEKHRSRIDIDRDIELKKDQAIISEKITWTDYHAAFVRGYFRKHEAKPLVEAVHSLIGSELRGAKIVSARIKGMDSLSGPLTLEVSMAMALAEADSETQVLHVPSYWEKEYIAVPSVERRQTPFQFEYPIALKRKLTVHTKPGIQAKIAGKPKSVTSDFFQFKAQSSTEGKSVVHQLSYENTAETHAADKYARFKSDSDESLRYIAESIILKSEK